MPKVTVLTPVYNVRKYLFQCLESLANQTLDSLEFICLDDGSTDGSEKILDDYAAKDKRFHVIHKHNEGYGKTMNRGIMEASGEYIGILEADDFAEINMFEVLYTAAKEHGADVVKSNFYMYTEESGDKFYELLERCPYEEVHTSKEVPQLLQTEDYLWTSIYNREFLIRNNIFFTETPGASYQDIAFSCKAALCAKRMYLLREAFLHYRVDNMSSSIHSVRQKIHCYHDEFAEYLRFLSRRGEDEQSYGGAVSYDMWRTYQSACFPQVAFGKRVQYLKRVVNEFKELQKKGWLYDSGWPNDAWEKMMDHMHHPEKYLFECAVESQKYMFIKEGFFNLMRDVPHLYLYGAGVIAKSILKILEKEKIHATGLLVSRMDGNPSFVYDVPVYELDMSPADKENDAILIAVTPQKSGMQQEIFAALEKEAYKIIFVWTKDLQEALR